MGLLFVVVFMFVSTATAFNHVFGDLNASSLCDDASVSWSVEGRGFHRSMVLTFHNISKSSLLHVLIQLPKDVFVDRFEQDASEWVSVPGQKEIDLEARADAPEAFPFAVAFRFQNRDRFSFPFHLRYPALAQDDSFEAIVVLKDSPRVWTSQCELRSSGNNDGAIQLSVPCGRAKDAGWVLMVSFATAVLGCVLLILKMQTKVKTA